MKIYLCIMLILYLTIATGCAAAPVTKAQSDQTKAPGELSQSPVPTGSTSIPQSGSFTLVGNTNSTTGAISFKSGTVTLSWRYQGRPGRQDLPGEMAEVAPALAKHLASLYGLARDHQSLDAAINQDMQTDLLDGDQNGYNHNQQELAQENNSYDQTVACENSRYQAEIAGIATSFVLKMSRKSQVQPVTILSAKGTYQGTERFNVVDASDYFFIIEASGPYQIVVTR